MSVQEYHIRPGTMCHCAAISCCIVNFKLTQLSYQTVPLCHVELRHHTWTSSAPQRIASTFSFPTSSSRYASWMRSLSTIWHEARYLFMVVLWSIIFWRYIYHIYCDPYIVWVFASYLFFCSTKYLHQRNEIKENLKISRHSSTFNLRNNFIYACFIITWDKPVPRDENTKYIIPIALLCCRVN